MDKNFNTAFCTIMRKPDVVVPDSEWERLNTKYPQHRVFPYGEGDEACDISMFPSSVADPIDAIYPVLTEDNAPEDLILETVTHLSGETQSVLMPPKQGSQLFKEFIAPTLPTEEAL